MTNTLIHVGKTATFTLFLRKIDDHSFRWFSEEKRGVELPTAIVATNPQEAIRLARREWKVDGFRTIKCGFRYTLPERDEHGDNALFHQMAASLSSMNGQYFDEEVGHMCIVHNWSLEAREFMQREKA